MLVLAASELEALLLGEVGEGLDGRGVVIHVLVEHAHLEIIVDVRSATICETGDWK